jgi:demethylmenaquinone methyltransferase/2-methoxy-6-polyprenyl-1,4-benzoquinol methylase
MSNKKESGQRSTPHDNHYAQQLEATFPLRVPALRSAIRALNIQQGSRGLDAGCGTGLLMPLLIEAAGPDGHVTGIDTSRELLSLAEKLAESSGLAGQTDFKLGDINNLPFDDGSFDWLWSADCAGYPARRPRSMMRELARVVKPGGAVGILIYSSQMLLPGHPRLEARLNATSWGVAPFTNDMKPDTHYLRALGWFEAAGLEDSRAQTFVSDFHAPLSDEERQGLAALIGMRWKPSDKELSPQDMQEYRSLCQPQSPDFILNLPDYYGFYTYTLFHGKKPV